MGKRNDCLVEKNSWNSSLLQKKAYSKNQKKAKKVKNGQF